MSNHWINLSQKESEEPLLLKDAGVVIADSPTEIGQKVKELLKIK